MRKNKKNWEIFSKSVKNNAIVCDHIPTTPALVTTTHNRENNMHWYKKNLANTITVLGFSRSNCEDILIETFDFSYKYHKHFQRKSFVDALAKKSDLLKDKVSQKIIDLRNKAKKVYNKGEK